MMTDLLLVEKVREALLDTGIIIGASSWPDEIAFAAEKLATAAIATVEAHRPPGTGYEEGFKQGIEAAAKVADSHREARKAARANTTSRKQRQEARDHESMAIEALHIATAIRALSPPSIADEVD